MYRKKPLVILTLRSLSHLPQRVCEQLEGLIPSSLIVRSLGTQARRWDFPPDPNGSLCEKQLRFDGRVHENWGDLGTGGLDSAAGRNPNGWLRSGLEGSQRIDGFGYRSSDPGAPHNDVPRESFNGNYASWHNYVDIHSQGNLHKFQQRANDGVPRESFNGNYVGGFQKKADELSREGFGVGAYGETSRNAYSDSREASLEAFSYKGPYGIAGDESPEAPDYKGTIEELDEFCNSGKAKDAVKVLGVLDKNGIFIDLDRCLLLLQACANTKSLEEARAVHDYISRRMGDVGIGVNNKILDAYSKCGSMADAFQLFDRMHYRNLTSWDNMIKGLAHNNLGEEAIDIFSEFKQKGLKPDGQMFISVFSACGAIGAIDEGMLHLESMEKDFGILPSVEHYVGIVDMLGRSGYVDEAFEFIEKIPGEANVDAWETLMNLCRANGNVELGDHCMSVVEHLDSSRVTENNKKGLLPVDVLDLAKEIERKKSNPLALRSKVHEYRAGDRSHPESDKIYALLRCLAQQMKEAGYFPETRFVLHDVDQESKQEALLAHSERLAVAYGCMTSPVRSEIRVIKNLRICVDCHNAMKIVSKIIGRKLTMRDAKRFHHFEDGKCSCNDYW